MNFKRRRAANRRAGCKLCKPWKINGFRTGRRDGEGFGNHRRRAVADEAIKQRGSQASASQAFGDSASD